MSLMAASKIEANATGRLQPGENVTSCRSNVLFVVVVVVVVVAVVRCSVRSRTSDICYTMLLFTPHPCPVGPPWTTLARSGQSGKKYIIVRHDHPARARTPAPVTGTSIGLGGSLWFRSPSAPRKLGKEIFIISLEQRPAHREVRNGGRGFRRGFAQGFTNFRSITISPHAERRTQQGAGERRPTVAQTAFQPLHSSNLSQKK